MHTCAVESLSAHLVCWGNQYGFRNLTLFEDRSEGVNKTQYRQHVLTVDPAWVRGGHDLSHYSNYDVAAHGPLLVDVKWQHVTCGQGFCCGLLQN